MILRTEITKLEKRYVELERSLRLAKMTSRDQKIITDIEIMLKDCRMTINSLNEIYWNEFPDRRESCAVYE